MDEKIQDNSIFEAEFKAEFEAELSDRYHEELMTDIPDIWDKISARLDSASIDSSANETVTGSTTNIQGNISSAYIPVEKTAPVIHYNKAAAKSSRSHIGSSALTRFIPIAAAVVVLCICVPVFIKVQQGSKTESATATAYETDSASATLDVNKSADYPIENKVAADSFTAGETYEEAYAEESEEACDSFDGESEVRSTEESATAENIQNTAYIRIYVVPDTEYSQVEELISNYGLDLESDSSVPNAYKLFPNHEMTDKELSGLCDEIGSYDFIVQAEPVAN